MPEVDAASEIVIACPRGALCCRPRQRPGLAREHQVRRMEDTPTRHRRIADCVRGPLPGAPFGGRCQLEAEVHTSSKVAPLLRVQQGHVTASQSAHARVRRRR